MHHRRLVVSNLERRTPTAPVSTASMPLNITASPASSCTLPRLHFRTQAAIVASFLLLGCASDVGNESSDGFDSTGGNAAGGNTLSGSGGSECNTTECLGAGGASPNAGGASPNAGGAFSTGGSPSTGGGFSTGGAFSVGGSFAAGGSLSTGGAPGAGGDAMGSGGVMASGGDGSGGGDGACSVEPANPATNQTARNVLCYLYEIYGEKVISGQQDCHWSPSSDVQYVADRTGGKYPAIVGGDFLYTNAVSQARDSWNAGGLSMIRYHMGRPLEADSYESSLSTMSVAELDDTLTPGSSRYNSLMAKFDHAASELSILQDAGVVVLWAPFHESQPGGWFWWSSGTGEQLKALWRLMFENFVDRGLNNLVWLFPFSGEPNVSFYPSPDFFDIAGVDTYAAGQPFANMYQSAVGIIGTEIPIPLHETGTIVNPDMMFNGNQAPWVLFSVWCDSYLRDNPDNAISSTYSNTRTVTRADLPSF